MLASVADFIDFVAREGLRGYGGWTESEIISALVDADDWILHATGREFEVTSDARYFTGRDTERLEVFECVAVDSVTIDGETVDTSTYQIMPLNGERKLWLRRSSGNIWPKPVDPGNIVVTASWGYAAEIPGPVVRATCLVAAMQAQTGGVMPDPTKVRLGSISAFGLRYASGARNNSTQVALAMTTLEQWLTPYVDKTARYSRLMRAEELDW